MRGRMAGMLRFSVKDILRGTTLVAVGFGMLAIAFNDAIWPAPNEQTFARSLLIAFGGMFVGYGVAFPIKYPPYQMILALAGMFAAETWQSGHSVGLLVFAGLLALLGCLRLVRKFTAR